MDEDARARVCARHERSRRDFRKPRTVFSGGAPARVYFLFFVFLGISATYFQKLGTSLFFSDCLVKLVHFRNTQTSPIAFFCFFAIPRPKAQKRVFSTGWRNWYIFETRKPI